MIAVGIVGVALFGLLIGLSSTYIMLVVFLGLMGLAGGGYHPAASPAVAASVEPRNRGSALGIHLIGGSASHFLAPLLGVGIATALGWRGSFIVLAAPTLAFGIIFYVVMGRMSVATTTAPKMSAAQQNQVMERPGRVRHLIAVIALTTFTMSVVFSVISFIPLYLVDHFHVSEEGSGAFMAIYFSTGLWASTLGGYLSDRIGRVRLILAVCFGSSIMTYFLDLAPFGIILGGVMLLVSMFGSIRMPVAESYIINNTSEKNRSTILGIYFLSGTGASSVLTPLIGYLIDNQGFSFCFTSTSIIMIVATFICWYFLRDSRDHITSNPLELQ